MQKEKLINLKEFNTKTGNLIALEGIKDIPFEIKRIFYIYNCDINSIRGNHANKESSFILICISGKVNVIVDNGKTQNDYLLDKKSLALYIPNGLWKKMYNFSKDTVLLCLSNHTYNPNEYIYDYQKFLEER